MKTQKTTFSIVLVILLSLIFVVSGVIVFGGSSGVALAEENLGASLEDTCKTYTDSLNLYGSQDGSTILEYESYINERYQIGSFPKFYSEVLDEWILKIVPEQLFKAKTQEFLYIGAQYGFYFDYDDISDRYFIYLMLHNYDDEAKSGHIIRKITPLYYEQYVYDSVSGKASLGFTTAIERDEITSEESTRYHYTKYSLTKKVYLKNISFNGNLYNENNLNFGETNYNAGEDNGGYFIGGSYMFKGVSTSSSKQEYLFDTFGIALGAFGGITVGKAITVVNSIKLLFEGAMKAKSDFRDVLTNENEYSYSIVEIERAKQIEKYNCLLKDSAIILNTPNTNDGVMFGIGTGAYVQSTFYYNYADQTDKWNTGFVGKVKLDIVEDNGNLLGNTVDTIAANIESNSYESNIYNGKKLEIDENQISDVYTLSGKNCPIRFVAPANGIYTIETFGNVKNTIDATSTAENKTDGINQKLNVTLKKDQIFEFEVVNKSENNGIFQIKAEFTPTEISLGETKTLTIQPGETEYLGYYNPESSGFNFSWNKTGVAVKTYLDSLGNQVSDSAGAKSSDALANGTGGKYLLGFTNTGSIAVEIGITANPPYEFVIGQTKSIALGNNRLYKFTSRLAASNIKVAASSSAPTRVILMDENFTALQTSDWAMASELLSLLQENKVYYILLSNSNSNVVNTQLTVTDAAQSLKFGNNTLSKTYNSAAYKFVAPVTGEFTFSATANVQLSVYNSAWSKIQGSTFAFNSGAVYYVVARGTATNFNITAAINYTASLAGTLDARGYRYIRYIPAHTDYFDINGSSGCLWFDSSLKPQSGKLVANRAYFLQIKGTPKSNYNISILRRSTPIQLRSSLTLPTGLYSFSNADAGAYVFTTYTGNGVSASYNILNAQREIVYSNIKAGGEYVGQLSSGVNYIEIIGGSKTVGIRINKLHSAVESQNKNLLNNVEQNVRFDINTDNNFVFVSPADGEYYFKFAYATLDVTFSITVTDSNLNKVNTTELTLETLSNDTLNKRYGVRMNLSANKTYYINVYYSQSNSAAISANVLISPPSIISDVVLTCGEDVVTPISGRTAIDHLSVSMGRTYKVSFPNALKTRWNISSATQPGLCTIANDSIVVNFKAANEGKVIYLNFIDDTDQLLTAAITVKFPYYVKTAYVLDSSSYRVMLLDRNGVATANNGQIKSVKVYAGNIVAEFNTFICSLAPYVKYDWNTLRSTVTLSVDGKNYTVDSETLTVQRTKLSLSQIHGTIQGSGQIIINATGGASSRTITVPASVTSMVYVGDASTLTNIKFIFEKQQSMYLYLSYFKVNSNESTPVIDLTQIDQSHIIVFDQNIITGKGTPALISCNNAIFDGSGSFTVTASSGINGKNGAAVSHASGNGAAGPNGNDGTAGTAGYNALFCNSIVKATESNAIITLQGGNGGNGGRGSNGGNGGPGSANPNGNTTAGNGGNGGHGGNGGSAGLGCIGTADDSITVIDGYAGWGGNGGRGGNGGNAANGGTYIFTTVLPSTDLFTFAPSGAGNGGRGGDAGKNGRGTLRYAINSNRQYGTGGNGGNGGKGGNGSSSSYKVYEYKNPTVGGNGGRGGDGHYGGNGGAGGNGGVGAAGRDGSLLFKVENGHPGAAGGMGGNGGNSTYSTSNVGNGGSGSLGGAGGAPGSPILPKNAANPGPNGANGQPGSPGQYIDPNASACVAAGTLITLADGRQIPVELLTGNELLLVWNLFTGKFDVAPILFIDSDPAKSYEVINLYFSDGTIVKVIDEHGFWDFNLNEYVFLRNDAAKYIGHWFNKQTTDASGNMIWTKVQLTNVVVKTEYTTAWSPVTYGHLCYYVNGMLSMPGATTGLINIFDVDPDTMKIDVTAMQADIAKYGLFTYEEFAALYPVPEIIFEAFGGQYLKIAMGKGLLTEEMLASLIERYSEFFDTENPDTENQEDNADISNEGNNGNHYGHSKGKHNKHGKGNGRK